MAAIGLSFSLPYTSQMPKSFPEASDPLFIRILELCEAEVPGFRVAFKDCSKFMKFLNVFAQVFNKTFMTGYITVMGGCVYFPNKKELIDCQADYANVLAHELVHMKEQQKTGKLVHFFRYGSPQIFAVLSLLSVLAFINPWFLLCLTFLLCLAPIPAVGRKNIEMNGYEMSLAMTYWRTGQIGEADIEWAAQQFTSSNYYFMYPFEEAVLHELRLRAIHVRTGQVLSKHIFQKVYACVKP